MIKDSILKLLSHAIHLKKYQMFNDMVLNCHNEYMYLIQTETLQCQNLGNRQFKWPSNEILQS